MTETIETAEPVETDTDATEPVEATEAEAQADTDAPDDRQDRDAAKYRRRLRETEAERDTLAAQVESLQREAIEAQANAQAVKPAALWASGVALADMLTETGTVDADKVASACNAARDALGLGPRYRNTVPREGGSPGSSATSGRGAMVDIVMGRDRG